MTLYKWSRTASADATADSTINWAEGQSPSSVNDSARAMMAATAKYRDDIAGAIVTGGTSSAYTISSYQVFDTLANLSGQMIAFTPHATNAATVTLDVDGLGAKPLRPAPGLELPAGSLIHGTPYVAIYNNSDAVWYLQGFYGNPYNIPLGGAMIFTGLTAPNSSFVLPYGQAISRTTYSTYYSQVGTTYGSGDGSSTFNVPDFRGRVIAGKGDMGGSDAGLLNATYFGAAGTTLGATGGGQASTLVTGNLPAYTPAGSISAITGSFAYSAIVGGSANALVYGTNAGALSIAGYISLSAQTFTGTAQGGTSTPVRTVQPTIICNYILRVI